MGELLSTLISYAVLAALVRVVLERAHSVPRSFVIVAGTVGTACFCQMLEMLTASRHPDLTQPALALLVSVPIALWPIRFEGGRAVPVKRLLPDSGGPVIIS